MRLHDSAAMPHVYNVIVGGRHDFRVWKSDLYQFAQLVFNGKRADKTQGTSEPADRFSTPETK